MLPELFNLTRNNHDIGSVAIGGAYHTQKYHYEITALGAHAVTPPIRSAKPWNPTIADAISYKEELHVSKYL